MSKNRYYQGRCVYSSGVTRLSGYLPGGLRVFLGDRHLIRRHSMRGIDIAIIHGDFGPAFEVQIR